MVRKGHNEEYLNTIVKKEHTKVYLHTMVRKSYRSVPAMLRSSNEKQNLLPKTASGSKVARSKSVLCFHNKTEPTATAVCHYNQQVIIFSFLF